jgi:hypothetical protein
LETLRRNDRWSLLFPHTNTKVLAAS